MATRDFADTKEWFGFIQPLQQRHAREVDGDGDVQVDAEIEAVAAELECDDGLPDSREKQLGNGFPAGSRWLAQQLNTTRPFGPVSSPAEKSFFESKYLTFQSSAVGRDADSFSFIDWSLFALFWNNWLADEDRGKRPRTDMVNKTSGDLQKYYKLFCRLKKSRLTMEGTRLQQKDLRISLRSPSRSAASDFPEAQPRPAATLSPPLQPASLESPQQVDHRVRVPAFGRCASAVGDSDNAEASSTQPHKRRQPEESYRMPRRCRQCGKECDTAQWALFHVVDAPVASQNLRGKQPQPSTVCSVPVSQREDGFPLQPGAGFPRRSRAKKR